MRRLGWETCPMHRLLALALAACIVVASCGDDADARDPAKFCVRLRTLQPALTDGSDPDALVALYQDLEKDAPLQVQDDWHEITVLLGELTQYDPTKPEEVQAVLAASLRAQASINAVGTYVRDSCQLDLGPIPTSVPIGGTGDSLLSDAQSDVTSDATTTGG